MPPASPSQPRAADIRNGLESDILTGAHAPGARLDETEIARRFGVSRTPVREALRALASTGLIELIPNRGAFVRKLSTRDLVQMFEVMAGLEGLAGRLAARRAGASQIARLGACLDACERAADAGDTDAYYAENGEFHQAVYDASGNAYLASEATRLHTRLTGYRRLQLRAPARMVQSLDEHRRIVRAISDGDACAAQSELHDHVAIQGERFADFVAIEAQRAGAG